MDPQGVSNGNQNGLIGVIGSNVPTTDAKNMAVLVTLASIFFGPFSALVGYLVSAEKPWVRAQMVELLNFEISVTIVLLLAIILNSTIILAVIGLPLMVVVGLGNLIYLILGAVRASRGEFRKYPWTIRLIS